MRCRFHFITIVTIAGLASLATAQTMTEVGAAAAGSAIGSAAGKKVSDGITAIFGKVDHSTAKAAKSGNDSKTPLLEVGPGVPKASAAVDSVPPPPAAPVRHVSVSRPAPVPEAVQEAAPVPLPPPPPPPPQVTAEDLKKVTSGMTREDVLKMGPPVSKITMFDDGHLIEIYSYATKDSSLGRLTLTDGAVSGIELR